MILMATAALAATTLITDTMNESERLVKIAPHLNPPPRAEATIDIGLHQQKVAKDLFDTKGFIQVTPPKGSCFTVTRHKDYPDVKVCKPKKLAFRLRELSKGGTFTWNISTGPKDIGHDYTWPTPYRVAKVIDIGKKITREIPTMSCTAHITGKQKRIHMDLFSGEKWTITFPRKNKLLPQPKPTPNLYIPTKHGSPKTYKVNPDDPVTKHWAIPIRGTSIMSSSSFKSDDAPPGMKGECRYQLLGAPEDPASGWIECHFTDKYDVIMTHLPCSSDLLTRIKK